MASSSDNNPTPDTEDLEWPSQPSGILIMGKRQGTKKENKQLWGRIAMAAALWYSAPQPKPYLIFVASDIHGLHRTPDGQMVKSMLVEKYAIPADFIIVRRKSNCTLMEVRVARALQRTFSLAKLFAVTHLYHAPRTQRYFNEINLDASVIPAHSEILDEIIFPEQAKDLFNEMRQVIDGSQPRLLDRTREQLIELTLSWAHTLDPRGRLERRLARILRPGTT